MGSAIISGVIKGGCCEYWGGTGGEMELGDAPVFPLLVDGMAFGIPLSGVVAPDPRGTVKLALGCKGTHVYAN